jgi:hypothetical protein
MPSVHDLPGRSGSPAFFLLDDDDAEAKYVGLSRWMRANNQRSRGSPSRDLPRDTARNPVPACPGPADRISRDRLPRGACGRHRRVAVLHSRQVCEAGLSRDSCGGGATLGPLRFILSDSPIPQSVLGHGGEKIWSLPA